MDAAARINFTWASLSRKRTYICDTVGGGRYAAEATDERTNRETDKQMHGYRRCVNPCCDGDLIKI